MNRTSDITGAAGVASEAGFQDAFVDLEAPIANLKASARVLQFIVNHTLIERVGDNDLRISADDADVIYHAAITVFDQAFKLDRHWTDAHNVNTEAAR